MPDADATVSRIRVRGRRAGSAHARDRHRLSERPLGGGLRPESAGAALRRIPWPGPNRPYVAGDAAGGQQDTAHGGLDVARPWPGEFSRSLRRSEPRARQPPRCSGRHGRRRHRDPLRRRCLPVPGRDHFAAYNGTAPVEVSSGNRRIHRLSRGGNRHLDHAGEGTARWAQISVLCAPAGPAA